MYIPQLNCSELKRGYWKKILKRLQGNNVPLWGESFWLKSREWDFFKDELGVIVLGLFFFLIYHWRQSLRRFNRRHEWLAQAQIQAAIRPAEDMLEKGTQRWVKTTRQGTFSSPQVICGSNGGASRLAGSRSDLRFDPFSDSLHKTCSLSWEDAAVCRTGGEPVFK